MFSVFNYIKKKTINIFNYRPRLDERLDKEGFYYYSCAICEDFKPGVIQVNKQLVCIQCRVKQVGISALDEPLYQK